MPIEQELLRELAQVDDPIGVVSILVDVDRSDTGDPQPAWELSARRALADVAGELRARGDAGREAAGALDEAAGAVDELLDPRRSGRGRALIVALSSGARHRIDSETPLPNEVRLGPAPRLTPLVAAACEAGPAGLAAVSAEGLRVVTPSSSGVEVLLDEAFSEDADDRRRLVGPAGANPAHARHSAAQQDLFSRRAEERLARFFTDHAADVATLADRGRWRVLAVGGEPRLAEPFGDDLRSELAHRGAGTAVVSLSASRQWGRSDELREALAGTLAELRDERDRDLFERAHDGALTSSRGALGAADVISALAEGRVEHLLVGPEARIEGSSTSSGQLVLAHEQPPGISPDELGPDRDLTDELVARALTLGADVTVPADATAARMREHGDIAAVLRW